MVSEQKIFFSMGANDPLGVANLDPSSMISRIYVRDHQTLLHTNSVSSMPHGSEKIFEVSLAI